MTSLATLQDPRSVSSERQLDRWALESMCCELLQNAESYRLVPLVNLLSRIECDIVSGAELTAGHQIVIAGLYRRHVGEWND